jgi:polyisoprenoid-binding protein YceI
VSTIKGAFSGTRGGVEFDPDNVSASTVKAEIDVASIDTHNAGRDGHIQQENFLNVEQFPTASFVSNHVEPVDDKRFKVTGDLTMHGETVVVTFDTTWQGIQIMPDGSLRTAFYALASVKRSEFGFSLGQPLDGGGFSLSDEVELAMYTTCNPKNE